MIFSDPYTAKLSDKSLFPFMTDQKAMWRSMEVFLWRIIVNMYLHMYKYIFTLTWSTEHRQKLFLFRARRLPSPVGTIIVMTIQIVARDKGNDSFASRSLSLSLHFFVYGDILLLYSRLQAWRPWPSSFFLLPPLLGYNCFRILCYCFLLTRKY
jgi:hypothetical protein